MIRALFICGKARARSPTAAQIFADLPGVRTDFGGLSTDADDALSADQIQWADRIFVMEQRQHRRLSDKFAQVMRGKRVINLSIKDTYTFMEPALVELLTRRAGPHLTGGSG